MPAFPSIDDETMRTLWQFVTGQPAETRPQQQANTTAPLPEGPVVAAGGAPGGLEVRRGPQGGPRGAPYPEGVEAPKARYYTGYGLGFPYIMSGRWSQITAYDLEHRYDPVAATAWRRSRGNRARGQGCGRAARRVNGRA